MAALSRTPAPGRRTRLVGLVAAALAAAAVGVANPGGNAAAAPPGPDAHARAAALATQVRDLRIQVALATEAYDAVAGRLTVVVGDKILAQTRADAARQDATRAGDTAGARARALYETGGPLSLYAGLLRNGDVGALAERMQVAQRVTAASRVAGQQAAQVLAAADASAATVSSATRTQAGLEREAAAAALRVTTLLQTQEQALAAADDEVRRLAAEEEQRRQAAEQAAFAASLTSAYAAAGAPLVLGSANGQAANEVAGRAATAMATLVGSSRLCLGRHRPQRL